MKKIYLLTVLFIVLIGFKQESFCQQPNKLDSLMTPFIGSWTTEVLPGQTTPNYRQFKWDLRNKVVHFFEFPGKDKKWRVKSVFVLNPVDDLVTSIDFTDWGNYVTCRIEPSTKGLIRYMTVHNSIDKKTHQWVSKWEWQDKDTWQSHAVELDEKGNVLNETPKQIYRRIKEIPKTVIDE